MLLATSVTGEQRTDGGRDNQRSSRRRGPCRAATPGEIGRDGRRTKNWTKNDELTIRHQLSEKNEELIFQNLGILNFGMFGSFWGILVGLGGVLGCQGYNWKDWEND